MLSIKSLVIVTELGFLNLRTLSKTKVELEKKGLSKTAPVPRNKASTICQQVSRQAR